MRRSFFRASGGGCFLFWAHSLVFLPEFTVSIFYAIMKDTGKGRRTSEDSMEKKKFAAAITDLLLALIGCLFILSASVVLVLNIRVIYYHDIDTLHLTKEVELTKEQIRENYDALIDYNLFWKGEDTLQFPDFPMSEHGQIHFAEVRRIFVALQYLMIGSAAVFFIGEWGKLRRGSRRSLKLTAILAIVLPLAAGAMIASNWEAFFVGFHHVMFSNDYWLFDPVTDPVILILPDAFFLHCALAILICVLAGSALCMGGYCLAANRKNKRK